MQREVIVRAVVFLMTALFFISLSVFATTVGTNIDATGTIGAATSTPWGDLAVEQVAGNDTFHPVFVVGDTGTATPAIYVSQKGVVSFGSSTPSGLFLNVGDTVIGRNGATSDLFVSGGLGVGDATTTDNAFVVGANLFTVYSNKNIGMFGTSSPILTDGLSLGGAAGTHASLYVSGGLGVGNATTTNNEFIVGDHLFTVYSNKNIGMFGTTTPILTDGLSLGGAAGTHADLYVSGGLGVGAATTTDGALEVGTGLTVYGTGDVLIGATTTLSGTAGFTVEKADIIFSSGADATTTLTITNESTTKAGCIEMTDAGGTMYRLYIANGVATTSPGTCN